jgi:hypothetical protein
MARPTSGGARVLGRAADFRSGQVPWSGLLVSSALSAGMLNGGAANFAQRDFSPQFT